jgi:RNA polymerase-binding transcription factor DksA
VECTLTVQEVDVDQKLAREQLLVKRQDLLLRLQQTHKDLHGRDERVSADFGEQSIEMEGRELMMTLDADGREELGKIDRALNRLNTGQYGLCIHCGLRIADARLHALTATETCIACAR